LPKVKVARNVPATSRVARRSRGLAIGAGQARPRATRAAAPGASREPSRAHPCLTPISPGGGEQL